MADITIYAPASDNILSGVVPTSTVAPTTSYSLATLALLNPATRVRWAVDTLTLTWTLSGPALGDVLIIPVTNLDPGLGSPATVTVTNGSGLSVAIDVPTLPANRIPQTIAVDLALADTNAAHRTSNVWHLVIVSNSVPVVLGGAVAIYGPKRTLNPDLAFGFTPRKVHALIDTKNEYLTRYRQDYETVERGVDASVRVVGQTQYSMVEDFYDGCHGRGLPGLLWVQGVPGLGAFLGTWQSQFTARHVQDTMGADIIFDVQLSFDELSKGKPI